MNNNSLISNPIVWIFAVCLLFFIPVIFSPASADTVFDHFALSVSDWTSRPWTILTSSFIHGDIFHFLINMVALYLFGNTVLKMIGWKRFLIVYFSAAIVSSFFFIVIASPGYMVLGSSGAIFGLAAVAAVLIPTAKVILIPIPIPMPMWFAVVLMLVVLSFLPNVAWESHLGGAATGVVCGLFMRWVTFKYYYRNRRT